MRPQAPVLTAEHAARQFVCRLKTGRTYKALSFGFKPACAVAGQASVVHVKQLQDLPSALPAIPDYAYASLAFVYQCFVLTSLVVLLG